MISQDLREENWSYFGRRRVLDQHHVAKTLKTITLDVKNLSDEKVIIHGFNQNSQKALSNNTKPTMRWPKSSYEILCD
jgi:hypothetical protein